MELSLANQALVQLYSQAIEALGREPTLVERGLRFHEPEVGTFLISLEGDSADPSFFYLLLLPFVDNRTLGLDPLRVYHLLNHSNATAKWAKLYAHQEGTNDLLICATAECYLNERGQSPDPALLKWTLARGVESIRSAVALFIQAYEEMNQREGRG